jgi:hypothetical protein
MHSSAAIVLLHSISNICQLPALGPMMLLILLSDWTPVGTPLQKRLFCKYSWARSQHLTAVCCKALCRCCAPGTSPRHTCPCLSAPATCWRPHARLSPRTAAQTPLTPADIQRRNRRGDAAGGRSLVLVLSWHWSAGQHSNHAGTNFEHLCILCPATAECSRC